MKVSKRCHYALRALVDLGIAQALGRPLIQLGDLAEKERLPLKFLEQILMQLRQAGVIESKRGSAGGYQLAVPASEICLGDVVRLMDGELLEEPCLDCGTDCPYPDSSLCGVRMLIGEVHRSVVDVVDGAILGDMVRRILRKIRRNKITVPFVKMLRPPRKRAEPRSKPRKKTVKPVRAKTRRKPIRKRHEL